MDDELLVNDSTNSDAVVGTTENQPMTFEQFMSQYLRDHYDETHGGLYTFEVSRRGNEAWKKYKSDNGIGQISGNGDLVYGLNGDLAKIAQALGLPMTEATMDMISQFILNEQASKNSFARTLEADSTKYQRQVADLQKAGLNPFLALGSGAGSANSQAANVSSGYFTESSSKKRQQSTDMTKGIVSALIAALGIVIAGAL